MLALQHAPLSYARPSNLHISINFAAFSTLVSASAIIISERTYIGLIISRRAYSHRNFTRTSICFAFADDASPLIFYHRLIVTCIAIVNLISTPISVSISRSPSILRVTSYAAMNSAYIFDNDTPPYFLQSISQAFRSRGLRLR